MFRLLRFHMKKILVITILLIVPPFVIWGVGNLSRDESRKPVGRLYGKNVSLAEYLQAKDACMLNLYLLYGPNFRDLLPMVDMNRQTWDRLLLLAKVAREGVQISDAEIAAQIEKIFSRNGVYDRARYEAFLQQANIPAEIFENRVRDTLAIGRLTRMVTDTAIITADELEENYLAKNAKGKASYIVFRPADYLKKISVTEAQERDFFAKHKEEFRVSEKVKARYVLLSPDDFKKGISISDAQIKDHYETTQANWVDPADPKKERVLPLEKVKEKIRQELTRQKAMDTAFERATDIAMSLFDQPDLAKAAKNAGLKLLTTDYFSAGDPKPPLNSLEFAQTAFGLEIGKNSQVVRTQDGFAILSPIEKKPAHIPEFEQAKPLVEAKAKMELARAKMTENAGKIREQLDKALKAKKGSLQELAKPLGLEVHSTGFFTKSSALVNVPAAEQFKEACFTTAAESLTPLLSYQDGAMLGWVEKREAGSLENFEKEKESLRMQLLAGKKENILNTWYGMLRAESKLQDKTRETGIN